MGGINDIRTAFTQAAPAGTTLKNLTMRYDAADGAQVFMFEIATPTATKSVIVRVSGHATPEVVAETALSELQVEVIDTEVYSNLQVPSMSTLIGGDAKIFQDVNGPAEGTTAVPAPLMSSNVVNIKNAGYVQHDGETYELVEDGVEPPKPALFF